MSTCISLPFVLQSKVRHIYYRYLVPYWMQVDSILTRIITIESWKEEKVVQ